MRFVSSAITGEEVGQKGTFHFPLERILGDDPLAFAVFIDRMSQYHPSGWMHYVNEYCGVPTVIPQHQTLLDMVCARACDVTLTS